MVPPPGGQGVVTRLPIVLRDSPLRSDQSATLHAVKRLIEGAVFNDQISPGVPLQPRREAVPVRDITAQRLEDEQVECAFEQRKRASHQSPEYVPRKC